MTSAAPPRLLPFQGRLTDANGAPVTDRAKVVQFKIYDAPTEGNAVWGGEVQKLSVNGGLVSTLLGSKADLSAVDFDRSLYLEITVDATADNQITQAHPPLLPRQSILPAVFAIEAVAATTASKMAVLDAQGKAVAGQAFGWESLFDNGNPASGKIPGDKLKPGTLPAVMIAAQDGIGADQ